MRRWVLAIVVAMLGGVLVSAQGDGDVYGLVTVNSADVRVGPDFAYDTIGRLERNASVRVLGRSGDFFTSWDGRQWLKVQWEGGEGWMYARLLRTSRAFNSIPPIGRALPRDNNGRVPDVFDLSSEICSQWPQGPFSLSGSFTAGDEELTVTYPTLQGANVYSVIVISPGGGRTAFDSETGTSVIEFGRLPRLEGEYTWRVAPYWTNAPQRFRWQQVCLLRTGGTFYKPAELPETE